MKSAYLGFLHENRRFLFFGFLMALCSSYGQTFFIFMDRRSLFRFSAVRSEKNSTIAKPITRRPNLELARLHWITRQSAYAQLQLAMRRR
jgi:hypothetical protein